MCSSDLFEIGSQLTNLTVSGNATVTGTMTSSGVVSGIELHSTMASGDEGGEIKLAKPPNGTLDGGVTIDAYQNKLRIFEQGGSARGVYIDLSAAAGGVGTNLLAGGGTSSNSFSGILVGANVISADSTSDRLTFVAGSGISISANPTTDTITFVSTGAGGATWAALTSTNTALRTLIDDRLQVANAVNIYQTKSVERAALANTNQYIATKVNITQYGVDLANTNTYIKSRASWSELLATNTAIRTLVSDRIQVANVAATYQTKAVERAALANTNAFIKAQLANTNAYIATKITNSVSTTIQTRHIIPETDVTYDLGSPSRRFRTLYISGSTIALGTANLSSTGNSLKVGGETLATNSYLTSTYIANTTARTLISDRYQVANVNTNFLKKTGVVAQTVTPLTTFSANVSIEGKLFVTGGIQTYTANNLVVGDNMIYLNANAEFANPDLGITAGYNDGTYHHTGFFRDASDAGTWKVFENYSPEPDANVYINTAHATFRLAPFAAQNITVARNLTVVANTNAGNTTISGFLKFNGGSDIRAVFSQNTYVNTILANTNSYIATKASWSGLTATNTAIRLLVSDRLQVANASATYKLKDRVVSYAAANNVTLNADTTDTATLAYTGAAGGFGMNAPTGTPSNGQKILFRLTTTNAMTFAWNAIFLGSVDLSLPTSSTGSSKSDYLGFIYNSTTSKWHLLSKNFGF